MGELFTSPVTLNDGTSDVVYDHVSDTEDKMSQITERANLSANLADNDKLITKQSKVREPIRAIVIKPLSFSVPDTDGQRDDNIWNLSLRTTKNIPEATIQAELNKLLDAATEANFVRNLIHGMS